MNETIHSKVKGTTFYDVPWSEIRAGDTLLALRDPLNPFDPNAIRLLHQGRQVGHLSKELAGQFAAGMDGGDIDLVVTVTEVTGGGTTMGWNDDQTRGEQEKHQGLNIEISILYSDEYLNQFLE